MPQTGEQCLEFLEKAREAVSELSVAEDSERQMEQDCQRLERELEAEQKQMADAVQATVKKRRQEISASYDSEINKAQDLLKKARTKREKAKNQGVKERIADETAELHAYNKELRDRMKSSFRRGHVPGFCPYKTLLQSVFSAMGKRIFDSAVVYDGFICRASLGDLHDASPAEDPVSGGNLAGVLLIPADST